MIIMIENSFIYLFVIGGVAFFYATLERKTAWPLFNYLPAIVLIYATMIGFSAQGLFSQNSDLSTTYSTAKNNLLPAMLFLMLLNIDFKIFKKLGTKLSIAYISAVLSLALSFVIVVLAFNFSAQEGTIFSVLAGSWMGGTANMLAVGAALNVSEAQMGIALVVDAIDYAFWVMLLLGFVPFAAWFNKKVGATASYEHFNDIGCACNLGPKRYYFLLLTAFIIALTSQVIAEFLPYFSTTTWLVLLATFFGISASFTPLKNINGSQEISSGMLYLLIAFIGSRADFNGMQELETYLFAGLMILLVHAVMMLISAKLFKLDLFSIALASLANIGGVASAPILAAAYNRSLIGVGVLMAIFGYLIGTFGGLGIGYILQVLTS